MGILRNRPAHSMILYGPPGCGKTTLARILSTESKLPFHSISAVSSGVKEVREIIALGKQRSSLDSGIILFIDEIHRFSKSQQDALLEAVESGWIYLIGATTENPSFEVIGPLLSRCQVYRLLALTNDELSQILERAFNSDPSAQLVSMEQSVREMLLDAASGDARKMLRLLETVVVDALNTPDETGKAVATSDLLKRATQNLLRNYDRAGENHYDFISAFIKSLRGSDPDAALIYMACMLEAGEDPLFIARRMIIFASEDVGNASPQALGIAVSAFMALERIGMPEGRIILSQAATFLASCPKSNASYKAINYASQSVHGQAIQIPNHLRNAPTQTHKEEGAGKGYLYPHDYPGAFVEQDYMPAGFETAQFYFPGEQGQEIRLKDRLKELRPDRNYG